MSVTVVDAGDRRGAARARRPSCVRLGVDGASRARRARAGRYDLVRREPRHPAAAPLMIAAACAGRARSSPRSSSRSRVSDVAVGRGHRHQRQDDDDGAHRAPARRRRACPPRRSGNIGRAAIVAWRAARDARRSSSPRSRRSSSRSPTTSTRGSPCCSTSRPTTSTGTGRMEAYAADKARVFANLVADDVAVIDVDDAGSAPYADTVEARGVPVVRVSRRAPSRGRRGPRATACSRSTTPEGPVAGRSPRTSCRIRGDAQREQRARRRGRGACARSGRSADMRAGSASLRADRAPARAGRVRSAASSTSTTPRPPTPTRCSRRSPRSTTAR